VGAGKGNGEGKGRGSYKQPGTRVDRSRTTRKGGIPSKRDSGTGRVHQAKGELSRGFVEGFVPCALIYCQPCIYRAIVCMLANKRIVFRL
jgi:hypothetical protein